MKRWALAWVVSVCALAACEGAPVKNGSTGTAGTTGAAGTGSGTTGGAGTTGSAGTGSSSTGSAGTGNNTTGSAGATGAAGTGSSAAGTTGAAGTGSNATGSAGTTGAAGTGSTSTGTAGTGSTTTGGAGTGATGPGKPDARGIYGHPNPATSYPTYAGFTPFLIEEFDNPIDLNNDPFWTWGDGALYEGLTKMTENNISFENGRMVLTIKDEPQGGAYSFSAADNVAAKPLSSGELRTIYNNFRYGRYEVRMKAPVASNFIHTMFAYRAPAYLLWREIDIEIQAAPTNTFISNIIVAPPGTRVWSGSIEDATTKYPYPAATGGNNALPVLNTTTDFHTYAFEWLPDSVKWYVDGTLIRTKLNGIGKNGLQIPKESTKIIMNLWVFTSKNLGGGDPAANVYPIKAEYDWFRFYKWNSDATYPCLNTPSCLPADDLKLAKNNPKDPLPDLRPDVCTGEDGKVDAPCGF
jgi:beta-glucanase (GH16 family)